MRSDPYVDHEIGTIPFSDPESALARLNRRLQERRELDRRLRVPRPTADASLRALCHDLRQPLAAIVSLAEIVNEEPGLSAATRRHLSLIGSEALRLADFVQQFVHRSSASQVDLGELVVALTAGSGRAVEVVREQEVTVMAEWPLLARAVSNVLDEACRAAGAAGPVRVTVRSDRSTGELVVEEGGGRQWRTPDRGGLGLYTAEAVLELLGGRLDADRSALGGTRVRLRLPLAPPGLEPRGSSEDPAV